LGALIVCFAREVDAAFYICSVFGFAIIYLMICVRKGCLKIPTPDQESNQDNTQEEFNSIQYQFLLCKLAIQGKLTSPAVLAG